jgi:hypothetical protein
MYRVHCSRMSCCISRTALIGAILSIEAALRRQDFRIAPGPIITSRFLAARYVRLQKVDFNTVRRIWFRDAQCSSFGRNPSLCWPRSASYRFQYVMCCFPNLLKSRLPHPLFPFVALLNDSTQYAGALRPPRTHPRRSNRSPG